LRLLYVSLTRAKERCYLAWGRINTAETSALAYLLRPGAAGQKPSATTDWIGRLTSDYAAIGDDELRERLEELAGASSSAIAIRPLPEEPVALMPPVARAAGGWVCREFHGRIDQTGSLTSYSALVSAAAADAPDRDAGSFPAVQEELPEDSVETGLFQFPAGAVAGTFFHSILETLDFSAPDTRPLVRSKLKEFGFDLSWEDPVCALIADLLIVPMFGPSSPVRLGEIRSDRRVAEMEFYFPLKPVTPGVLEHVVAAHGGRMTRSAIPVPETVGRLHFAPIRGYMKGFIDLVFEHQGRFYLVDWKSNRLGSRLEDYHRNRLDAVMVEHWYHVQYYLYTLAFHQYLRNRVPGYDYARDFGGICYVFLRGVTRDGGPEFGLFHDRPAPALVQALGETLIERYA